MERIIKITSGRIEVQAALNTSPTADAVWDALPLTAEAQTWGDEIYFSIPVRVGLDETAVEVVAKGDVGYWPSGAAFCIFFGPTPISTEEEIRPASAVNIFGKVTGPCQELREVQPGSRITVHRADA